MKQTRREAAESLFRLVKKGPDFYFSDRALTFTPARAREQYQIWAGTWVLPYLERLVPELKPAPRGREAR